MKVDAAELLARAHAATEASTESVFVPEWNCEVVIRALNAAQLWEQEATTQRAQGDQGVMRTVTANWLMAGILEPQLSLADVDKLIKEHAAPTDRLLKLIQIKSQLGVSVEDWALSTLELQSTDLHLLAEFYRRAKAGGQDLVTVLRGALATAEAAGETTLEAVFASAQALLADGWEAQVEAEKKDS